MTEFDAARRAALMEELLGIVTGKPARLLPFAEVKEELHLRRFVDRGIDEAPLDRIVGTVGRQHDFTRAFLPRHESLRERWGQVTDLVAGPKGFPPVELYRVGGIYFVVDGHHRVSVARRMGLERIEARVREFQAPVPLAPDTSIEEVMLMGGLADFLEATGLKVESDRPDEFRATELGAYERLLDHVTTHKYYLGIERSRPVECEEAAVSWRENVFRPMIEAIRNSGILAEFPKRTETDLYLFTMDHLHYLREQYGRAVTEAEAVQGVRAAKPAKASATRGTAAPRVKKATGTTPRRRKS